MRSRRQRGADRSAWPSGRPATGSLARRRRPAPGDQARLAAIAGRRLANARAAAEIPKPQRAAALALVTSSRPEASEKLIATFLPTPRASRMPAVAPTFATAPPAVIGTTPAAALRQMTQSAVVGENAKPSALRSRAVPTARVVQQASR